MVNPHSIFQIKTQEDFEKKALEVFRFQFENVPVYRSFCDLLYVHHSDVKSLKDIPFLPITFFKSHQVLIEGQNTETVFSSSGTTGQAVSKHHVSNLAIYEQSFTTGFKHFYGPIEDYTVLALLPSYLERSGSSLIYMAEQLIALSKQEKSGFYLHNLSELHTVLEQLEQADKKTLLIGVSFALLDLAEKHPMQLRNTIVMETGGMKGRRKELIREELHDILKSGLGVKTIHSEYGMTELLSQAYSKGHGVFECPKWMQVVARDPEDALSLLETNKTGGLNIIDLANINSCAFIATQDLGKVNTDGTFEVLGRFDHSDIRGCNLMAL
ncbi:MAG TPA: hypothetical protein VKZ97_01810 [Flavobacteriaceae bacterium]|nr:hypothetical protein [Flavobacteriaceae bacterium]